MSRRSLPSQKHIFCADKGDFYELTPTGCRNMPGDRWDIGWQSRGEGCFAAPRFVTLALVARVYREPAPQTTGPAGKTGRPADPLGRRFAGPGQARDDDGRAGCAKKRGKVQPHPQQFQSLSQKSPLRSFPRLPHRCHTSAHSRRRMDRRRCGPGGRKASWPRRNVRRDPGGGGGRRAPLAALSTACGDRAKARPTGLAPRLPEPVVRRDQRRDGGTGLWRIVGSLAPGFVPDAYNSLSCLASVWAGAARQRQTPVGCGHHPANFGPRACCATPVHDFQCTTQLHNFRRPKARVRASGN